MVKNKSETWEVRPLPHRGRSLLASHVSSRSVQSGYHIHIIVIPLVSHPKREPRSQRNLRIPSFFSWYFLEHQPVFQGKYHLFLVEGQHHAN